MRVAPAATRARFTVTAVGRRHGATGPTHRAHLAPRAYCSAAESAWIQPETHGTAAAASAPVAPARCATPANANARGRRSSVVGPVSTRMSTPPTAVAAIILAPMVSRATAATATPPARPVILPAMSMQALPASTSWSALAVAPARSPAVHTRRVWQEAVERLCRRHPARLVRATMFVTQRWAMLPLAARAYKGSSTRPASPAAHAPEDYRFAPSRVWARARSAFASSASGDPGQRTKSASSFWMARASSPLFLAFMAS